jgi:hypothetical protein
VHLSALKPGVLEMGQAQAETIGELAKIRSRALLWKS